MQTIQLNSTTTLTIKQLSTQQTKFTLYINNSFYMSNIPQSHLNSIINQLILQYQ